MSVKSSLCDVQYKIGQKQPRMTGATLGGLQVAMHLQLPLGWCLVFKKLRSDSQ